jgi:hypothetical protein
VVLAGEKNVSDEPKTPAPKKRPVFSNSRDTTLENVDTIFGGEGGHQAGACCAPGAATEFLGHGPDRWDHWMAAPAGCQEAG